MPWYELLDSKVVFLASFKVETDKDAIAQATTMIENCEFDEQSKFYLHRLGQNPKRKKIAEFDLED